MLSAIMRSRRSVSVSVGVGESPRALRRDAMNDDRSPATGGVGCAGWATAGGGGGVGLSGALGVGTTNTGGASGVGALRGRGRADRIARDSRGGGGKFGGDG